MDKKYELLKNDSIEYNGKVLYRIKALKNFDDVEAGDLGGYIASETNLSHKRNCWIYSNAKVFDNAEVLGNAKIYGNAKVYGNALVFNDAKVCNSAKVYGDAWIFGNAKVYGNACIYENAKVYDYAKVYGYSETYGDAEVCGHAKVYGNASIYEDSIIGEVSLPYKDILQFPCKKRILTAILTENDEILYSIGCQNNITEEEFIERIHNEDGGVKENPHREEYLRLIKTINFHFKGE